MKSFQFKIRGNSYQVTVGAREGNVAEVEVNGTKYEVELEKEPTRPATPRLVRGKTPAHTGPHKPMTQSGTRIVAPLPGTITEIRVKVGDQVSREQSLLTMEAMKMENNVLADSAGTVKSIHVEVGGHVLQGDVLIELA